MWSWPIVLINNRINNGRAKTGSECPSDRYFYISSLFSLSVVILLRCQMLASVHIVLPATCHTFAKWIMSVMDIMTWIFYPCFTLYTSNLYYYCVLMLPKRIQWIVFGFQTDTSSSSAIRQIRWLSFPLINQPLHRKNKSNPHLRHDRHLARESGARSDRFHIINVSSFEERFFFDLMIIMTGTKGKIERKGGRGKFMCVSYSCIRIPKSLSDPPREHRPRIYWRI